MELFIKSDLALDDFALRLREILNLPESNRTSYHVHQRRYGVNRGGEYYLFDVLGLELLLIRNQGEVEIPERAEYPYYLIVQGRPDTEMGTWEQFTVYLRDVLRDAGLQAEVDPWTPVATAEADE